MNRDSNNQRSFGPNQTPRRWWIVMIALMLALGSTGQTPIAQAAPPAELVVFSMKVRNPKTTLRCRETVTYLVKVELAQSEFAPTPEPGSLGLPKGQSVINVEVSAVSADTGIGEIVVP